MKNKPGIKNLIPRIQQHADVKVRHSPHEGHLK